MEKLLTPSEVAALLGIAEQTVYNRKCLGASLPPAVRLGRLLRFPEAGVKAWLAALPSARTAQTPQPAVAPANRRPGRPTKAQQVHSR